MAYVKQIWANGPSGSTPLNADRMNYIENGIATVESEISQIPLNRQAATVTAYTLVLSDAGKSVYMQAATAQTLTVPTNATVPYPIGTWIEVVQNGAGALTIAGATGVSVVAPFSGTLTLSGSSDRVRLQKTQTDTWAMTRINGIPFSQRGSASGVATLDTSGVLPVAQTPFYNASLATNASGVSLTYSASPAVSNVLTVSGLPSGYYIVRGHAEIAITSGVYLSVGGSNMTFGYYSAVGYSASNQVSQVSTTGFNTISTLAYHQNISIQGTMTVGTGGGTGTLNLGVSTSGVNSALPGTSIEFIRVSQPV